MTSREPTLDQHYITWYTQYILDPQVTYNTDTGCYLQVDDTQEDKIRRLQITLDFNLYQCTNDIAILNASLFI